MRIRLPPNKAGINDKCIEYNLHIKVQYCEYMSSKVDQDHWFVSWVVEIL